MERTPFSRFAPQRFQAIFVMQADQYRGTDDSVAVRDSMPVLPWERVQRQVRDAGTEAGVWSTLVVVSHPLAQNGPKIPFIQSDQPIQTLTTARADQPLAERVRLRAAYRISVAGCAIVSTALQSISRASTTRVPPLQHQHDEA